MTYAMRRNWRTTRKPQAGFALVEKMFYYYHRIKREVDIIRIEQGYYKKAGNSGGGGGSNHSFISDPTADIAIKHYEQLPKIIINAEKIDEEVINQPEKWLMVIEQTMCFFSDDKQVKEVLERRFFKNESMARTCITMEIDYHKYYRLRDIGISYARECAIQLGLIKVFNN